MDKNKKSKNKKVTSKSLILRICVLAFTVYAAISLVEMQVEISARRQMLDELKKSVDIQKTANRELERQLDAGLTTEKIERIAREKLDYVYPNEKIYIDISGS